MSIRFTHAELVDKALFVLREVAEQCNEGLETKTIKPTRAIRFALAFLSNGHDRGAFDLFWRSACVAPERSEIEAQWFGRRQSLQNSLGFIHRLHGREPL